MTKEEAIRKLQEQKAEYLEEWVDYSGVAEAFDMAIEALSAERKKGKWIMGECDQCGAHAPFWPMASTYYESDFCPNCGTRMER